MDLDTREDAGTTHLRDTAYICGGRSGYIATKLIEISRQPAACSTALSAAGCPDRNEERQQRCDDNDQHVLRTWNTSRGGMQSRCGLSGATEREDAVWPYA